MSVIAKTLASLDPAALIQEGIHCQVEEHPDIQQERLQAGSPATEGLQSDSSTGRLKADKDTRTQTE